MIKDIKYNGYSANTSDYECADGDLAITMGLIQEDGTMKPVSQPDVLLLLGDNAKVLCIHKIPSKEVTNIIYSVFKESSYSIHSADYTKAIDSGKIDSEFTILEGLSDIAEINIIGNTLCICSKNEPIYYAIWQNSDIYKLINYPPPFIPVQFASIACGQGITDTGFTADFDFDYVTGLNSSTFSIVNNKLSSGTGGIFDKFPKEESLSTITNSVLAVVNKAIADNTINREDGRFIFPFIVRYALRMYDGTTLTMHSSPILMIPNSHIIAQTPNFFFAATAGGISGTMTGSINFTACQLAYKMLVPQDFEEWRDLISSLDIFISSPLYTYDQAGYIKGFHCAESSGRRPYSISIRCNSINSSNTSEYETRYSPAYQLLLPQKSDEDIINEVKSCCNFYLIHSIPFDEIVKYQAPTSNSGFSIIPIKGSTLASLTNRERMTDDYHSHHEVLASRAFTYNSKLHLYDIKEKIKVDMPFNCLFPYLTNPSYYYCPYYGVSLNIDNKIRKIDTETNASFNSFPRYLFFPHTKATQFVIMIGNGDDKSIYAYNLKEHETLNGSVFFCGYGDFQPQLVYSYYDFEESLSIEYKDRLYVSEINNPFIFPVISRLSFPGDVLGISSAAKALSEGQFGQFPLYALTSEGVWALEVSNTGTYSTKQPITRDVVINPDSITQLDSAVLFASDRGIMLLSGSTTQCISDTLNTQGHFSIANLPDVDKLISIFNSKADVGEKIKLSDINLIPFSEFLAGCRIIYDYTNQRIVVYNILVRYAYVYSFKSHTWGMMYSNIVDSVNSYPEALAFNDEGKLVDFSKSVADNITALVVTRPFKFDDPDTFKTINTIIQRGQFRPTHVQQVLYGSNDLEHWHTVWSSVDKIMRGFRGTPYKAYRLALICKFDKGESIYGFSVSYEPRINNQLR